MTRPAWMLVAVTFLWGFSFTWMRAWQAASADCPGGVVLSALTLIALRSLVALPLLGLWQPHVVWKPRREEHLGGLLLGAVFLAGSVLQTWALAGTTPALSSFFTSLASAWVPILALALGQSIRPLTALGLAVAVAGCAALVLEDWAGLKLGWGEWLTLVASVVFAAQVLVLDRLGKDLEPAHLSAGFLAAAGVGAALGGIGLAALGPGLPAWLGWLGGMLSRPATLATLACLVVFPTVLGFHWMNTYQPRVGPSRAALIYLLEPAFAAAVSLAAGYDEPSYHLALGGALVLAGNAAVAVAEARDAPVAPPPDAPPACG